MKYYLNSGSRENWNLPFLLLIILHNAAISTIGVQASPLRERHICGLAQCKDSKKFYYKAGAIYSYSYTVNVTTSIEGGPGDESGMHLSSAIAIKFLTGCEAVLSMKDVKVWESHLQSGSEESFKDHHFTRPHSDQNFATALQQFPLRFSYADGVIEEICPEADESVLVLNVKRGLLSAFQNTMRRLDLEHKGIEDDIHGQCKVEYKLGLATSSSLTIERTKDIGSCGDKFGILSAVQGTPYHFGTLHQSMPAVLSTSDCEHVVDRNLLSAMQCCEIHKLESLARGSGAAMTRITQSLKLSSVHDESRTVGTSSSDDTLPSVSNYLDPIFTHLKSATGTDVFRRESLQFKHDFHLAPKHNEHQAAIDALASFCSSLKEEVGPSAGDSFETLVSALRGLNSTDMMILSEEATDICQGDRIPFDDAVEAVGTEASVHLIKDRILNGQGSPGTIRSWIDSLTYIPKPDLGVMAEAVEILRERVKYPEILLTFSTLAHSYCKSNSNCSASRPIDILSRLYKKFFQHTGCVARQGKDVEQILMYLRGIGNFGLYSLGIKDAVSRCIHKNDRTEVRVAAIEAYRRMGCIPEMDLIKSVFENPTEDSEVRIAAFLSIMRCPSYDTIKSIKKLLETEQVNQVGSFVVTYLRNLQETALPSKAELQGLVSDENFSKSFSSDFRKFSRSFEVSAFYDDFNFGVGLDSNLIFSQKSYLPRSASLNLTIDLFGESINVFETTLRLENFEHYIEFLFGPNGKFRNPEIHSVVSSLREKRATPNKRKLRQLAMEFDAKRRYNSDPTASVSLKTFGNEIFYKRSVGVDNNSNFIQGLNPFEWIKNLANQNSNFQKSKMFLDSTYIIPTGIGLPLNLTAQASVILKFETETEFVSESKEFKVKGKLKPSAMLAVCGNMIFGVSDFQTGIKVKAHLRSSTAVDATFHIRGTELIQGEFGLPKTQLELLEYKSELLFVQGKVGRIVGKPPQKPLVCSRGLLQEMFGLKICHSFHFNLSPNSEVDDMSSPYFPLNGPAFFHLVLDKGDPSLLSTKVTYAATNNETNSRLEATYGIKTAQHTKSFGLVYDMDKINQNLALGISLPGKEMTLKGTLGVGGPDGGKVEMTAVSNNVQVLGGMISFVKTEEGNGKALLKPTILIKLYNSPILHANGEMRLENNDGGLQFDGNGMIQLEGTSITPLNIRLSGLSNGSRQMNVDWEAEYGVSGRAEVGSRETVKWKSRLLRAEEVEGTEKVRAEIDTSLSLHFSQFPDYNLEASWKYQKGEESVSSIGEIQMGPGPSWSDRTALLIRHHYQEVESYGAKDLTWLLQVIQPVRQSQWGFEGSLKSAGNSLNSTINLQYAPGQKIQTSFVLERAQAGALALFDLGTMIQIPNQKPLEVKIRFKEKAPRIYEGSVGGDWFGKASLQVQMNFLDRTWRQKLDKELRLGIVFGTSGGGEEQRLDLGSILYSDDKESKLSLNLQHESKKYSWEVGHTFVNKGSKRHRFYSSVNTGGLDYLLAFESGIDDKGLEASLQTTFNTKFPDIYAGFRVTKVGGIETIGLDYQWDASRDASKAFTLLFLRDSAQLNQVKYKFSLRDPHKNWIISAEQKQEFDGNVNLKGRISWSLSDQITFNGHLKKIQGQSNSYDISIESQTPFKDIKNTSVKVRLNCANGHDCLISIDGSWGLKGKVSGVISSSYEILPPLDHVPQSENGSTEEDDEADDIDEEEDEGEFSRSRGIGGGAGRKTKEVGDMSPKRLQPGYKFRFNSNVTTSVQGWKVIGISMQHTQNDPFHLKTDIDMQLPGGKVLSISNQWDLPRTFKEIWSTRAHFQAKTPFPDYQTFDLQGVLGHKEDSDTLATFGIYTDHSQYSITLTGTPKLDMEDGSIGFDLVTSVPNYDKIFGSLSYGLGESSRLACQLGWPKVLIGLETGFEWTGSWEEFQAFLTLNSPWEPLQNINTLAKIDTSQAEFKFLLNDEGLTAKSEWLIETWNNFDLRFDASSPFTKMRRIGLIAKQSFDEEDEYYSHISGWVNDAQIGYKWEGRQSELEDEASEGISMTSEVEIDIIVYPTIRGTSSLVRRESKYNVETSLVLREGPINLTLELNLLESYRFNEKIRITTPYSPLYELQINLNPAIRPEQDLYNFGFDTKWKSYDEQQEGGLIIRIGDQKVLADALAQDMEDEAVEEDADDKAGNIKIEEAGVRVNVPFSQIFHIYTPWTWAKTIKIELEKVPEKVDGDEENFEESDTEDSNETEQDEDATTEIAHKNVVFPWKTIQVIFNGDSADVTFNLKNEIGDKELSASLSLPEIQSPLSLKFFSKLDLGSSEKKLSLEAISHWPKLQEIQVECSYQKVKDYLNMRIDLETPFPSWEVQHASWMYAHNVQDEMDTLDVEMSSEEYGKLATNIVRGPLSFSIILNTPLPDYTSVEFSASSELLEDSNEETYETEIVTKIGEKEPLKIIVESTIENNFPKSVNGTITTTLRGYEQGNLGLLMRGSEDELNANGQIDWRNEKLTFSGKVKFHERKFNELDIKVNTPLKGLEKWKVALKKVEESSEDGESAQDENEEEESESINFLLNAETPWTYLSPLKGKVKISMTTSSPLVIRGLAISGTSPNGSLDLSTSWMLSNWNKFEITSHSKYNYIGSNFISKLPNSNFLKFKMRNFIPNFERIERVDSSIYFETQNPASRYGSSAYVNFEDGDPLILRLSTTLPKESHHFDFSSNYDSSLLKSKLRVYSHPATEILTSTVQIHRRECSLEGDVVAEWGDTSAIQSKFNCTYSPTTYGLETLQAQLFLPKSQTPAEVIGSIDGTFDNLRTRHKIRIEGKGNETTGPLLVDLDLSGHWTGNEQPKYLDTSLSINFPLQNFPSSNFYFKGKVDDGMYGRLGGKVGSQNASLHGYWLKNERADGSVEVNTTFGIDLPTEGFQSGRAECYLLVKGQEVNGKFKLAVGDIEHIDSTYNSQVNRKLGSETFSSELRVGNKIWPFGITRKSLYAYTPNSPNLYPTTTLQFVEVFDLVHSNLHKLGGEVRIERTFNGREITLTGSHPLRNVSLSTKYEFLDQEFRQNMTFRWANNSHMGYELRLQNLNHDEEEKVERKLDLKINYPVRVIRMSTGIIVEETSGQIWTELDLNASTIEERPGLRGILNWDTQDTSSMSLRKISAIIKHPLLPQDIRAGGEIRITKEQSLDGRLSLDYSGDPKRRLTFSVKGLKGQESGYYWNITTDMRLQHAVTNLDLEASHSNRHLPHELSIITLIDFKNSGKLSRESKITFELFKQLKKLQLMIANSEEHFDVSCQLKELQGIYHFLAETNITGYNPSPKVEMTLDSEQPYFRMTARHGTDGSNGLYSEGGVLDSRNVKFDISESYDNFRFSDVNFFLRMNHSRLVTSKLIWRPELFEEIQASYVKRIEDLKEIWSHQSDKLVLHLCTDSAQVYNQVWENAKTTIEPFMEEMREKSDFGKDCEALSQYFEEALEQNDFYMDDITGLAQIFADQVSLRFSNVFINLRQYREEILGDTTMSELFENGLLWILEKAKEKYRSTVKLWETYKLRNYNLSPKISFEFPDLTDKFSYIFYQVLDTGFRISEFFVEHLSSWMNYLGYLFQDFLERHRPAISATVHKIEIALYQILLGISDFIYETRDEVIKSSYYQKLAQLAQDVDQLYRDILENDIPENTSKYYAMLLNFLHKKTNFEELKKYFDKVLQQVQVFWITILDLSFVKDLKTTLDELYLTVKSVAEYTHFKQLAQHIMLTLYEKGPELMTQTVLEANAKYQQAKTKFIFDVDKGIVDWEQKLPMPWSAFNTPPLLTELPEYTGIMKLNELFHSSRSSIFDVFYQTGKGTDISWFPPFDGSAMIAGSQYFFTFDGRNYNFSGSSVYLLAGDLVEGNFTISIDYKGLSDSISKANIIVTSGHNTLIIDFNTKTLRDPKRTENVGLPIQMHYLEGYRDGSSESLIVQSVKGEFYVKCNLHYALCQLSISGWHSRKVGGLLGTMDHEPGTDIIYSNGKISQNIYEMARSWDVSDDTQVQVASNGTTLRGRVEGKVHDNVRMTSCKKLFVNRLSLLQPCFNTVDINPYIDMCINGNEASDTHRACLSAMTYVKMCQKHGIQVHMPSACITCDLNGETMIDRDVKVMDLTDSTSRSTDIVFIVEAKDCNKQLYAKRRLETLINQMEIELKKTKITNNRYAVVSFGGDGVFEQPRSILVRGELFTEFEQLPKYFKAIHTSNNGTGSKDAFGAIMYSLNLNFRPGVTKIIIFLPCTFCQPKSMTIDFAAVQYALLEQAATLHILLHKDLEFDDKKIGRKFFGMDNEVAYTKFDGEKSGPLRGNRVLRSDLKLSKRILGYCGPLALKTNGTIFNGKKLQKKREPIVNSFARVFGRRIAKAAEPLPCHSCTCSGTNDGVGHLKCLRCDYHKPGHYNPQEYNESEGTEEEGNANSGNQNGTNTPVPEEDDDHDGEEEEMEENVDDEYEEYSDGAGFS